MYLKLSKYLKKYIELICNCNTTSYTSCKLNSNKDKWNTLLNTVIYKKLSDLHTGGI